MKYNLIIIILLIGFSCRTTRKDDQSDYRLNLFELGIDSTKFKVHDCFAFDETLNHAQKGFKEVAVSVEIRDTNLLYAILIENGLIDNRDPRKFIFLNKEGIIVHNQTYAWKTRGDTIKGLICTILPDSINEINLIEYQYPSSEFRFNKKPLKIRKAKLPFRKEGFYKTLKFRKDISGFLVGDINDASFLIKSYDEFDQVSYLQISTSQKNIEINKLKYDQFYSFAANNKGWSAKTNIKPKRTWEKPEQHLIVGSDTKDLNKSSLVKPKGSMPTSSIYFGDDLFHLDTYGGEIYKSTENSIVIDSSFWEYTSTIKDIKTLRPVFGVIEYSYKKFGIRYGDHIFSQTENEWKLIHKIENLENCSSSASLNGIKSSTSLDNSGFYFIANSKVFYSDYTQTHEIISDYENIITVKRGPANHLIFKLGSTKDEIEGLIYNVVTKEVYPIYSYKINHYFDFLTALISYRSYTNSILLMTNFGLYEFDFDEVIEYQKRTRDNIR